MTRSIRFLFILLLITLATQGCESGDEPFLACQFDPLVTDSASEAVRCSSNLTESANASAVGDSQQDSQETETDMQLVNAALEQMLGGLQVSPSVL